MDNFDRFRYLVMCLQSILRNNRLHIQKDKRNLTVFEQKNVTPNVFFERNGKHLSAHPDIVRFA